MIEMESETKLVKRIKDAVTYLECGIVHTNEILIDILTKDKPEPLPPTHEEIMMKWWKCWDDSYVKVYAYSGDKNKTWEYGLLIQDNPKQDNKSEYRTYVKRDWFTNRESAIVPPEAT